MPALFPNMSIGETYQWYPFPSKLPEFCQKNHIRTSVPTTLAFSKFAPSCKFLYDRSAKITVRATLSQPVVTSFPITDDAPVIATVIFFRGD